jgi:hypothetical protein
MGGPARAGVAAGQPGGLEGRAATIIPRAALNAKKTGIFAEMTAPGLRGGEADDKASKATHGRFASDGAGATAA